MTISSIRANLRSGPGEDETHKYLRDGTEGLVSPRGAPPASLQPIAFKMVTKLSMSAIIAALVAWAYAAQSATTNNTSSAVHPSQAVVSVLAPELYQRVSC